jgi:tRNA pseudouridine32 synthase/23S rRNA pseudouridine746 synthase
MEGETSTVETPVTPDWVLFTDESLVVVNKPAGLLSVPDGYDPSLPHLRSVLEPLLGKLWMVHRLDKETSGLMVLARDADTHRELNRQFREHEPIKHYLALVAPQPSWNEISLEVPLKVNADRAHRTRVDFEKGKPARTDFQVVRREENWAELDCTLYSGVTHQIRAHLYYLGLGILGDPLYQPPQFKAAEKPEVNRMMLHASELTFTHPKTGALMHFQA